MVKVWPRTNPECGFAIRSRLGIPNRNESMTVGCCCWTCLKPELRSRNGRCGGGQASSSMAERGSNRKPAQQGGKFGHSPAPTGRHNPAQGQRRRSAALGGRPEGRSAESARQRRPAARGIVPPFQGLVSLSSRPRAALLRRWPWAGLCRPVGAGQMPGFPPVGAGFQSEEKNRIGLEARNDRREACPAPLGHGLLRSSG